LEALARLDPTGRNDKVDELFSVQGNRLAFATGWQSSLEGRLGGPFDPNKPSFASAVQSRIGDLLIGFLGDLKRRIPASRHLCVGGSLFYNSYFNSRVKRAAGFEDVHVPINPGDAGLAVGAALHVSGPTRRPVTPFSGPAYSFEEIKATLDNCKLTYQWASESETIALAVEALRKGHLVAWFDGPMEYGARALGARSILANPFAPYVLDNLNRFLKQREVWRGYALSGLQGTVMEHFDGPITSPYMECDYTPRDRERFRHVLPTPSAAVRVQTVNDNASPRFRALLRAFGDAAGLPVLVNTSFNGFREPIVCSPRDAIRVFFGTGLDMLVFGEFVISK
jgi:carbamoyltransferase